MRSYIALIFALFVGVSLCTNGVTTRTLIKDFSCFKQNHYVYAIVRAWLNFGKVDPAARETLIAAEKAKLLYADVYMNPCIQCKMTPQQQVIEVVKALNGTKYGTIMVQIALGDKWSTNETYNCEYVNSMVAEIQKHQKAAGVASDADTWEKIMGKNCEVKGDYVGCWWIKHDKQQGLDHFKPFGGFTFPAIKEFDGPAKMCGSEVDLNFCNC